jgi:phage-related baseplate assembly protein
MTISGLTDKQQSAVAAAVATAPDASWGDGIVRSISALLGDSPPFSNADVLAAIRTTLADADCRPFAI